MRTQEIQVGHIIWDESSPSSHLLRWRLDSWISRALELL